MQVDLKKCVIKKMWKEIIIIFLFVYNLYVSQTENGKMEKTKID